MSRRKKGRMAKSALVLACLLSPGSFAHARKPRHASPFKFVGGTEKIPESCKGLMEVGSAVLTFTCPNGSVSVPYDSISLMQYRPDISRKIRKMKIKWAVKPQAGLRILGGNKNRYFTIVYEEQGTVHAIVLEVPPETMRPYLAEIDVKSGKRVEVEETEEYD
ncbi:MAG: hypothetical protein ACYDA9_02270 [Terriglobia bacterium]